MPVAGVVVLALWALLLVGLWWFSTVGRARKVRYRCCDQFDWVAVADFGEVAGFELDLGRCAACQTFLMAVYWEAGPSLTYVCLSQSEAERFLGLQDRPQALHKALKRWVS